MTKKRNIRFRNIYKILLSASIVISGIIFIIGCGYIYFACKGYSRDIVADVFSKINIPAYICLALIIGDIIWEFITPDKKIKKNNKKNLVSNETLPANNKQNATKFVILGIAVTALVVGFFMGGYADVLTKAVNICTECIGLG